MKILLRWVGWQGNLRVAVERAGVIWFTAVIVAATAVPTTSTGAGVGVNAVG